MTEKEAFEKEQDKLREQFGNDPILRRKKMEFLLEMRYPDYKSPTLFWNTSERRGEA